MREMSSQNATKAIRLIDYLTRLASLRAKIVRDLDEYVQVLWLDQIPKERGCYTRSWGKQDDYGEDIWIEIQSAREPDVPDVPSVCRDWVVPECLRNTEDFPQLRETVTGGNGNLSGEQHIDQAQLFEDTNQVTPAPEIRQAWDSYLEQEWLPWAEEHRRWAGVQKVYASLFAIHQEQLRLGEEYELILGFGLLTWQTPSNQRVRRHLVAANALLEFEARLGRFTVRAHPDGTNLRPELDMLDIEHQPARAEETARDALKIAADDPWAEHTIEGVLKALVHSISPDGEYDETADSNKTQFFTKPMVALSPALILRKRSVKGLTDVLKRIRQRIEHGEAIPFEFADLAEITETDSADPVQPRESNSDETDYEVYFPKPSNEEQRRIVEKTSASSGVLVQGPPGTGKSHTIANLVCHLLATGQRTLITAKTPRALQVLQRLIPNELRPLCISLLGSGLEEKRSLEVSVNAILRRNEEWDETFAQKRIKEKEQRLAQLRQEKIQIESRLRAIRESETHSQTIVGGAYRGTASQIAQRVQRAKEEYAWFKDEVPFGAGYSLADINFPSLLKELRWLTPEKRRELSSSWPDSVPATQDFENLTESERKAELERERTSVGVDPNFFEHIVDLGESQIESIHRDIGAVYADIQRLRSLPHAWGEEAIRDVASDRCGIWLELHRQSTQIISRIKNLAGTLESTDVTLPQGCDLKAVCSDAEKLKSHLENGGRIGWGPFRPKAVKSVLYVVKHVRVNGQHCNSLEQVSRLVDVLRFHIELERGWNLWGDRTRRAEGAVILQYRSFESLVTTLQQVLSLREKIERCKHKLNASGYLSEPSYHSESCLQALLKTCAHALATISRDRAKEQLRQLQSRYSILDAKTNSHAVVKELTGAVTLRSIEAYRRIEYKIQQLNQEKLRVLSIDSTLNRMQQDVPMLVEDLKQSADNPLWDQRILCLHDAWRWSQAQQWIVDYINKDDSPGLSARLRQIEEELGRIIAQVASYRAWSFCFSRMHEEHRRNMEAWEQSMRRLGKGTGKHAPRHRREAQKHLNNCREAVPGWIMPLHRVWDTVDPAPATFDMIIVDEASQCGFEALPLLYLSKKVLIVGDDKQISPDAVGVSGDAVSKLMDEYLYDFQFRASFDVAQSLFDHGKLRYGTRRIALREHFRCMPEIIQFSNDLCYSDSPLIPLRQYPQERLVPIAAVHVPNGYREGSGSRVINRSEAEAVVEKILALCRDAKYDDKTIGVVVLQGDAQAGLIEEQLLQQLGAEEMEKRRLICGNPYSFQGDERDVILLSLVAAPNERIGPLTMAADERRFNVAASRARDQMWLFHSVDVNDLSRLCLRRQLLEFFEQTKPQIIAGIDAEELRRQSEGVDRSIMKPPNPFDSWFEVDVCLEIARKGYQALPQFRVAGKRIDIVVEGGHARLAVECDGDEFHGVDNYEDDMQRQRILERCGWVFFRVRGSQFYADKKGALSVLWQMLAERGIFPERPTAPQAPEIKVKLSRPSDPDCKVEIGDTVVYVEEQNPNQEHQVLIIRGASNPDYGEISAATPVAQALLGGCIGDSVEARLPMDCIRLRIKDIKKGP